MSKHVQSMIRVVISAFVLFLTYLATGHGISSFQYNFTNNNLSLWASRDVLPSSEEIVRAEQAIISAEKLWPDNPTYLMNQAAVYIWGTYSENEPGDKLLASLNNYERALAHQPLSPWVWSEWVMTKWRLEQYDSAMSNGIISLDTAGPYTGEANLTVVNAGLKLLSKKPEYDDDLRDIILSHYRRAEYNGKIFRQMRQLKEDYDNPDWLPELVFWLDRQQN